MTIILVEHEMHLIKNLQIGLLFELWKKIGW